MLKMVAALALATVALAAQSDAAAHKAWMDDAADAQDELKEMLAPKSLVKAVAPATKLEELMGWAANHADDIVKLAQESRGLAKEVAAGAKAGSASRANTAFAKMNKTCNTCHDLHPEKR